MLYITLGEWWEKLIKEHCHTCKNDLTLNYKYSPNSNPVISGTISVILYNLPLVYKTWVSYRHFYWFPLSRKKVKHFIWASASILKLFFWQLDNNHPGLFRQPIKVGYQINCWFFCCSKVSTLILFPSRFISYFHFVSMRIVL